MHRSGGRRLGRADTRDDLRSLWREFHEPGVDDLAIQEGILGPADESWIAAAHFGPAGALHFVGTGRKIRQLPVTGGVTTFAVTEASDRLEEHLSKLGRFTGFHGVLGADFRFDQRDGEFKLLDINPRLGANWKVFSDHEGSDAGHALYLDLAGSPPQRPTRSVPGRRWVNEELDFWAVHELSRRGEASHADWIRGLASADSFAYWSGFDPLPVWSVGRQFGRVLAHGVWKRSVSTFKRQFPVRNPTWWMLPELADFLAYWTIV